MAKTVEEMLNQLDAEWNALSDEEKAEHRRKRKERIEQREKEAQECYVTFKDYIVARGGQIVTRQELEKEFPDAYKNFVALDAEGLLQEDLEIHYIDGDDNDRNPFSYNIWFKFGEHITEEEKDYFWECF